MLTTVKPLPVVYLNKNTLFLLSFNNPASTVTTQNSITHLGTILQNLTALGYTFSPKLLARLKELTPDQLGMVYEHLLPLLKEKVGAHRKFKPMYPNFPRQVMEADKAELFVNAILHYWFGLLPEYEEIPRKQMPLPPFEQMRVLEPGTEEQFKEIPTRLLAAKSALTPQERDELVWFFEMFGDRAIGFLPEQIPFKETLALAASLLLKHTTFEPDVLNRYVKTATDVLRIAVGLSGGDTSLAKPAKFRSFPRPQRRLLLGLLEAQPNRIEDVLRYPEQWKRLAERLHPGEMKIKYPLAFQALQIVREGKAYPTFAHKVEESLHKKDLTTALASLKTRPGEFVRRLDHLLRLAQNIQDTESVLATLSEVAGQVATPVLLQVIAHFKARSQSQPHPLRIFFPKGQVTKAKAIPNTLSELGEAVCSEVLLVCRAALVERFGALPALGKVYIDENLKQFSVPLSDRAASKSLRTLALGSRLPIPAGSTIRFFLWWKEGKLEDGKSAGQVDIDLSAVMYDADWNYKEHISYTHLVSDNYQAAHSGDITSAPEGACEFIDLDIASVLKYGGRYVVMSVGSYSGQPFASLPECFAGWMMRSEPESGEIFEPATVQDKIDLASDTTICLPVILDLVEQQVIWTDLALKSNLRLVNNTEANRNSMTIIGQALTSLVKPDLYELFSLHALARATLVSEAKDAEVVFTVGDNRLHVGSEVKVITPFDQARIKAEYL